MAMDILEVVPLEEIPNLLKVFEKDWPKYYPLNQYVKIFSEYREAKVEIPKQHIYRYGDIENGVYLIESLLYIKGEIKYRTYFIYTVSEDLSDLKDALMRTSRIPWDRKELIFEVTFEKLGLVVGEVARAKGHDYIMRLNYMMWLPEPVDCGTVPEEMYIASLDESHVAEIDINWPNRFPGSELFLEHQIKNNFGLGLFRKADKKLACSAISFHSGGIFVLFTDPEFRGKGYAGVIIRHMADELHKRGRVPFASILVENIPSQKVFANIGFKNFTKVYFAVNL